MKAKGERLIDYNTPMRPTRNRLLTAMCVSACTIALLLASLGSLVDFAVSKSKTNIEHGTPLTMHIKKVAGEGNSKSTAGDRIIRSLPREQVASPENSELQQEIVSVDSPDPPVRLRPEIDWREIADEVAKATVDEYFRQEESRASMWQRTHSIMFQPANDMLAKGNEPIISNFRFKPRVHVVGLGVTIGSCFIGIPIVGVPVVQRTAAIRLFVCAEDSG